MKKKICLILVFLVLIFSFNFNAKQTYADETIYLGGYSAGFSLYTRGAYVAGLCDVITDTGLKSPSKDAEIKVGDIIIAIGEHEINSAVDIEKSINNDKTKNITLKRNGEIIFEKIIPAKDINGKYKLGVFIKDNVNGIGTMTFIKGNRFASLGHPVVEDNGNIMQITGGELYSCNITGCVKGKRGEAGELHGVFLNGEKIASIEKNCAVGVFGEVESEFIIENKLTEIEIGTAIMGNAVIYSTIHGDKPCAYDISIIKIDNTLEHKNFVVKINDEDLIDTTGGIVQGMSGSPIVQNGKLVGAITHVFINDPTRGFGISIDNMINN